MIAVRITPDMEMAAVAAPEHFRRYGFPQTPADLVAHPCIATSLPTVVTISGNWCRTGKNHPSARGQWALSDSYMEAEAARLGLGLAYVPVELVADDLERGTLIRVLQRYSLRMDGLYLYYPHRNVSPALRAVIDTLKI
jgi:DNA-binding transcriptional LysR family regulator